jgi:hypothetical protein
MELSDEICWTLPKSENSGLTLEISICKRLRISLGLFVETGSGLSWGLMILMVSCYGTWFARFYSLMQLATSWVSWSTIRV